MIKQTVHAIVLLLLYATFADLSYATNLTTVSSIHSTTEQIIIENSTTSVTPQPNLQILSKFHSATPDLQLDLINIINERTLYITNLYYNGSDKDVYWYAGNGSTHTENLTLLLDENNTYIKLQQYDKENITFNLSKDITVSQIKWLSVRSNTSNRNLGYVNLHHATINNTDARIDAELVTPLPQTTSGPVPIRILPNFKSFAHGLKSGPIYILDEQTLYITSLFYDGLEPAAFFWIGNGTEPSENGMAIPDESGSTTKLKPYGGQNITLHLPANLTVNQFDWLSLWCVQYNTNFGHVYVRDNTKYETNSPIQLPPFKGLAHGLRSGPILIIDERTFYVTNLHYDGKGPDAHFWVGNGTQPSPTGTLVPDENGSLKSLSSYTGQNVYVQLPDGLTVHNIEYFGMWCIQYKHNFGHVIIPKHSKVSKALGYHQLTVDGKNIIRIQKCCPIGEIISFTGCIESEKAFQLNLNVYEHNETHLNTVPIPPAKILFEPFTNNVKCEKFRLDPGSDNFSFLQNGSLMYVNEKKILSQEQFCMDTDVLKEGNDTWITTAFICASFSGPPITKGIAILYSVALLFSAVFFITTALIFAFIKEIRDNRGKCVIGYTSSMALAFITLASAQFAKVEGTACNVVGFFFQFLLVSSFCWLLVISIETYYMIISYNKQRKFKRRFYIYAAISLIIPLITLGISAIVESTPDIPYTILKPHFGRNHCWFESDRKTMFYFYCPVLTAISLNFIFIGLTKYKLLIFDRPNPDEFMWTVYRRDLRSTFRACFLVLAVMTLCWTMEVVSFMVGSDSNLWIAIDIINSVQGLFVFIVFVLHRPIQSKILSYYNKLRSNGTVPHNGNADELQRCHWSPNNVNNSHSDFLTNLRHESEENLTSFH